MPPNQFQRAISSARNGYDRKVDKTSKMFIKCSFLPHMNAIAAARQIGSTGIALAPMAACATGI
jgi:3-oxoacyl-(acyl-carrier-protein) synthase